MTISYLTMRRWIGILALAFPILIIVFGGFPMQTSISAYYWTNAGVLFTAFLFMMGLFLLSYKGYDRKDNWMSSLSGAAMMAVALFPCEVGTNPVTGAYLFPWIGPLANAIIHYAGAVVTFTMLGVMSMFQFTKSKFDSFPNLTPPKRKVIRNRIYRICAWVIFGALAVAAPLQLIPGGRAATDPVRLWFWLEALMVWAFGVSWLVKGETLWRDQ